MVILLIALSLIGGLGVITGILLHIIAKTHPHPKWWNQLTVLKARGVDNMKSKQGWILVEGIVKNNQTSPLISAVSYAQTSVHQQGNPQNILDSVTTQNTLEIYGTEKIVKVKVGELVNPLHKKGMFTQLDDDNPFKNLRLENELNLNIEVNQKYLLPQDKITALIKIDKRYGQSFMNAVAVWRGDGAAFKTYIDNRIHWSEKLAPLFIKYSGFFTACSLILLGVAIGVLNVM